MLKQLFCLFFFGGCDQGNCFSVNCCLIIINNLGNLKVAFFDLSNILRDNSFRFLVERSLFFVMPFVNKVVLCQSTLVFLGF